MSEGEHYPQPLVPPGGTAPVPRRLRGFREGRLVFDSDRALYLWEFPPYPHYRVPLADVDPEALAEIGDGAVVAGEEAGAAAGTVRFEWGALDAWFEEDEQVFVHARNPYARVDALRSSRPVRVELDGVVLAESGSTVTVFETGLPPRRYFDRTALAWEHLEPSELVTSCPYKGTTSAWWSVRAGGRVHRDLAWSYDFPTLTLAPIAGLVAFFDEHVDTFLDGVAQPRPVTPFSERPDA